MAVGDRFKKFDLAKLRTYEKYDIAETEQKIVQPQVKFNPSSVNTSYNKNLLIEFQNALLEKVENIPVWFEYTKEKQQELVENFFDNRIKNYPEYTFSIEDRMTFTQDLYKSISGFGKLDYLLKQDNITMVLVNNHNVLIEISGKILNADLKLNESQVDFLLKNIYHNAGIDNKNTDTIINCKIDNFLITILKEPVFSSGKAITIRKQPQKLGFGELTDVKFMPKDVAELLLTIIQGRKNIIITGAHTSGKTFLADNILTAALNYSRTAVIEDIPQLITKNEKISKYCTKSITDICDFMTLFNAIIQTAPEYILSDIKNNGFIAQILDYAATSKGNIITMPALNAENIMTKAIGLLQTCGYSEKLAKSVFLNSIDYIITVEKNENYGWRIAALTEVTQAKTTAQSLKDIYNVNENIILKAEAVPQPPIDNTSIRSRFTKI